MLCAFCSFALSPFGSDTEGSSRTTAVVEDPTEELTQATEPTSDSPSFTATAEYAEVIVKPTNTNTPKPSATSSQTPQPSRTPTSQPTRTLRPTNTPKTTNTPTTASTSTRVPSTSTPRPPTSTLIPSTATEPPTEPPAPPAPVATEPPQPTTPPPAVPTEPPAPPPPTEPPPPAAPGPVVITNVNKRDEFVDILNQGSTDVDLGGWMLRSEKGSQDCGLGGILGAGQSLRIWAMSEDTGQGGFNCGFGSDIWNNSENDPAVLFNSSGAEVSRR